GEVVMVARMEMVECGSSGCYCSWWCASSWWRGGSEGGGGGVELVTRMAAGVWGSDDGDGHEGGVMVAAVGEAAGRGGGAWRRVDMGIG
ncbi:hypothetical protein Tco_0346787, partial [Tanacetum coccineum]